MLKTLRFSAHIFFLILFIYFPILRRPRITSQEYECVEPIFIQQTQILRLSPVIHWMTNRSTNFFHMRSFVWHKRDRRLNFAQFINLATFSIGFIRVQVFPCSCFSASLGRFQKVNRDLERTTWRNWLKHWWCSALTSTHIILILKKGTMTSSCPRS